MDKALPESSLPGFVPSCCFRNDLPLLQDEFRCETASPLSKREHLLPSLDPGKGFPWVLLEILKTILNDRFFAIRQSSVIHPLIGIDFSQADADLLALLHRQVSEALDDFLFAHNGTLTRVFESHKLRQ